MIDPNLRRPTCSSIPSACSTNSRARCSRRATSAITWWARYRAFDYNQVVINSNGFLQDFLRAQKNGFSRWRRADLQSRLQRQHPGQPATHGVPETGGRRADRRRCAVLPADRRGRRTWPLTTRSTDINPANAVPFFQNPNALGADYLTNYSNSSYNALQVEVRRRTKSGFSSTANYTWSKVLSDADGDVQNRAAAFPGYRQSENRAVAGEFRSDPHDQGGRVLRTAVRQGPQAELQPAGQRDRRMDTGRQLTWQSGAPFSILSGRGTLNRGIAVLPTTPRTPPLRRAS